MYSHASLKKIASSGPYGQLGKKIVFKINS